MSTAAHLSLRLPRLAVASGAVAVLTLVVVLTGHPLRRGRSFMPYSVAGTLIWTVVFTLLGYAFSGSLAAAGSAVTSVLLAVALVGVAASLLVGRSRRGAPAR